MDVEYSNERFDKLAALRSEARSILRALESCSTDALVYGSVARGDVNPDSDVDIFIPDVTPSYQIQLALRDADFSITSRTIIMATPWHLPKIHFDMGEERIVTAPLVKPRPIEREFYRFAGCLTLDELDERRVPGVNKDLKLIKPTPEGHEEEPVEGQQALVARRIGTSVEMVQERINVLSRRERVGRTGVHIKRELAPNENVETVLRDLVEDNPKIRQRFRG